MTTVLEVATWLGLALGALVVALFLFGPRR
jgi:hypothetical protein